MITKIKIFAMIGTILASFAGGIKVANWRHDANLLKAEKAIAAEETRLKAKVQDLTLINAARDAELLKLKRSHTKEVTRELQKTVYLECVAPDSGVQLYNRTAQGLTVTTSLSTDPLR